MVEVMGYGGRLVQLKVVDITFDNNQQPLVKHEKREREMRK
jgi:hypothetical protein